MGVFVDVGSDVRVKVGVMVGVREGAKVFVMVGTIVCVG
jgi:hypothetical protein